MKWAIWKWLLAATDEQAVSMPTQTRILSAQLQGENICLWGLVNPECETVSRRIYMHGTGHTIEHELGEHVGTVVMRGGTLVFHVFDGGEA